MSTTDFLTKLRALGFDVLDKRQVPETEWQDDDVELVKWARGHKRIYLGFDLFKGMTGPRISNEIRRRGGRVITLSGGPEQPTSRSLGKLLFHQETWEPFLAEHGKVAIETISTGTSDKGARIKKYRREELPMIVTRKVRQGASYLKERKIARQRPLKRRPRTAKVALEQGPLT